MNQTKITAKIYKPLHIAFGKQINSLYLKRDAFLNNMIKEETKYLAEDLGGKRLSSYAKKYIAGELKQIGKVGTVQVNIVVEQSTADALNKVVKDSNLVRDAFLNRLILLLLSPPNLLKYLELPEVINGSSFENCVEPMPTSPLVSIQSVLDDPLYYLREAAAERLGTGIYLIDLPPKFVGFSCYLDDSQVPGTQEHENAHQEAMAMLDELMKLDDVELAKSNATKGVTS
jgi:hypothetical protein